jgi:hypothetical protein
MDGTLTQHLEALRAAPPEAIRQKYRELFGEEPRSKNRHSLVRRIGWRLQAHSAGGLSERARQRALELANDADVRLLAPRSVPEPQTHLGRVRFDRRIPAAGAIVSREYRGNTVSVKVLADGFEYDGRLYRSLSAIASEVTGTRWNGLAFFGLTGERGKGAARDVAASV